MASVLEWAQRNGVFFALILLALFFAVESPRFLTLSNVDVILTQVAAVALIAIPGAMLVVSGYVDLSVGSVAVLTAVVFGQLVGAGLDPGYAVGVSLAVAACWGVLNGVLIAHVGMSSIIVTLGGLAGARGLAELISQGETTYSFGPGFAFLGNGDILGVRTPIVLAAVAVIVGIFIWYQTPYGRHMKSIGADSEAARALGLRTHRIPLILYTVSGLAAGFAGILITSRLDAATLSIGDGLELEVLTAILLGGVAFTGGRGELIGVVFGVLFIGALRNGLVLIDTSPFFFNVAVGIALVAAAALDVAYQRLERIRAHEPLSAPDASFDAAGRAERQKEEELRS